MPGPGSRFSEKQDRQAAHIAASERARGMSAKEARSIGYATISEADPLEILDAIDRERGESFIGMIQANQVQRLRTEIVALRKAHLNVDDIDKIEAEARDEALEEAARLCDRIGLDGFASDGAAAIRALKDKA